MDCTDRRNPSIMDCRIYALLSDAFATDQTIWLFHERTNAERARRRSTSEDALIIVFNAPGLRLNMAGPIFLAVTTEDDGVRIRHGSRSPLSMHAYLASAPFEGICRWVTGWAGETAGEMELSARRA